jgi:hypothetical protein
MSSDGPPPLPPGPSTKYLPSPARAIPMHKERSSEILLDVDTLKLEPRASNEDLQKHLQQSKEDDKPDKGKATRRMPARQTRSMALWFSNSLRVQR